MNFASLTLSLLLSSCSASIRGSFNENHNRHLKHSGSSNDGGAVTVRDGDCEICSRNNKDNKPTSLMIQYRSNGVNSYYQNANKATCTEGTYPSSTTISVDGLGDFDVSDGDTFVLNGHFGAETTFEIEDSDSCMFHTSCSVPLVAGDQIGPFLILGSDEICSSGGEEEDSECVICDESNKVRPEFLTVRYHADGANSKYQNENKASCRSGSYPNQSTITAEGQTFDVSDGEIFSLYPRGDRFDAETDFAWSDSNTECYIHTSCSVPLVVGDRIGPFEILAGNDCEISSEIPSQTPSAAPSMMPSEKPSTQPSGSPSVLPSFMPSDKPSSNMPSSKPSSVPSEIPSQAPSDSCIEAEVRRVAGNKVVVDIAFSYNDNGPVASDWVGLYPCEDENITPPFSKEPAIWAYTCYNRNCRFEPFANGVGNFTFDDATVPTFGTQGIYNKLEDIIAEKPGCYVALLNRIDGDSPPPYYNICIGNEIELY